MYSYNKMKPKAFSTHLHRYYEFLYFMGGEASYVVEGNEYSAEAGDLFITCPGEIHSIVFKSQTDYERHFIQISEEFLADLPFDFLKILREKKFGENNKISHILLNNTDVLRCFYGVGRHVTKGGDECEVMVKSYVMQLLYIINALLYEKIETKPNESERVVAAKEYINANLSKELKLESIAEASFSDKYYLSHLFRRETGMSITDYIAMQRIALAKKLISEYRGATQIYQECGFKDYSSFYRAFKKLSGKSPTEFLKK